MAEIIDVPDCPAYGKRPPQWVEVIGRPKWYVLTSVQPPKPCPETSGCALRVMQGEVVTAGTQGKLPGCRRCGACGNTVMGPVTLNP